MKRSDLVTLGIALVIAVIFIGTGTARLPLSHSTVHHAPVVVYAEPRLDPLVVTASRRLPARKDTSVSMVKLASSSTKRSASVGLLRRATAGEAIRMRSAGLFPDPRRFARASAGEEVAVSLTQYCLKGVTRRGRYVRPGIVAADPRIFPLARYVEVFMGRKYLGRFLVDDTGGNVIGATLDIWTPSCRQATRFGRQHGKAVLVARDEEHLPFSASVDLGLIPDLAAVASMIEGLARR